MGKAKACMPGAKRCIPNDDPCSTRQTLVQDFGDDSNISIAVRCCNEGSVDFGDPRFGERCI